MHVPPWHEFKYSAAAEIGVLHSQPFVDSHFHFLITAKWGTSLMTRRFSKIMSFTRAVIIYVLDGCWTDRCDQSWTSDHFVTVYTILWHDEVSLRHHQAPLPNNGEFWRWKQVWSTHTPIHTTNFFDAPTFQCRCHSHQLLPSTTSHPAAM
jgi:hypothetical protein